MKFLKNILAIILVFSLTTGYSSLSLASDHTAEKQVIKVNEILHHQMDVRKKNTEEKSRQMKIQAIRDVKNASINIAFESIEKLMLNSLDESKLDKIYNQSVDETKLALQKKSS